jgi:hypothetical protein
MKRKPHDPDIDSLPRGRLGKPDISCGANHVVVCSTYVPRPDSISPMQWLNFWERIISMELR